MTLSLVLTRFIVILITLLTSNVVFAEPSVTSVVLLRGLDKITARITTFEVAQGTEVAFGTLRIIAHTCRKLPPEEPPEVSAFLQIEEESPG